VEKESKIKKNSKKGNTNQIKMGVFYLYVYS